MTPFYIDPPYSRSLLHKFVPELFVLTDSSGLNTDLTNL